MLELFASDIHFPYEDRAAYGLFVEVAKKVQPDLIFLGGDIIDCYSVSKYDRDPARKLTLQADLNYTVAELSKLREVAPNAEITFLEGNHETRLTRYLHSKAEELSVLDALNLQSLLRLQDLNIRWISNGTRTKIGKLWHLHGNEIAGGGSINVARQKFLSVQSNIIFGHHHVLQNYIKRDYEGNIRGAWANGCLCDVEPDYAHYTEWTQGFTMIEYAPSGNFNVDQIPVIKRSIHSRQASCFFRGEEVHYNSQRVNPNKEAPHAQKRKAMLKGIITVRPD
jgi:predicted phosphodiesterase